jgi:leucyl aminopeptidase
MIAVAIAPTSTAPLHAIFVHEGVVPQIYAAAAQAAGFTGEAGATCLLLTQNPAILLTGLGDHADAIAYENAGSLAAASAAKFSALCLDLANSDTDFSAHAILGAVLRATPQTSFYSSPDEDAPKLVRIEVLGDHSLSATWQKLHGEAEAVLLARHLVTLPGNFLNPQNFADHLAPLRDAGITIEKINVAGLRDLNAGALLAVGQASATPPCFLVLRWEGHDKTGPIVFAGKGITFDTGGICIKHADKMWEMRADMAGAAACAGAMLALARAQSPFPAIAILALAENAIGDNAYRPSDVLTMLDGTRVEIVDTDAEGRLVLADALAYAARFQPRAVIDIATLTGSIVSALGHVMAGYFTNQDHLSPMLAAAMAATGEKTWPMPIDASHRNAIKSDIADLRHCSSERMQPDACQAAAFLQAFTGDVPWVHIDMAGMDLWDEAADLHPKGATGFGVRLLAHFAAHLAMQAT